MSEDRSEQQPASVRKKRDGSNLKPWRWKPGQSGNPGGRPKKDMAAIIAQAIFEKNPEAIYKAYAEALRRGNPKAFAVLADRGFGKVPQRVEVTGADGAPAQIEIVLVNARSNETDREP